MSEGTNFSTTITSALDARYVWMPYHATAISPRMTAGMFAPSTPKVARHATGYGTPATWLGFAMRLHSTFTSPMPIRSDTSTCQLVRPSAKRLPANT
ncbi:hypothetical protein AWB72_04823 [Caballeronia concitans]|uniref:Uncharacterized protein n=1 Tax=Caballeronia concitans TaxID=1777133 RepID=A0A658R387_9BURK|nr:hypothetical protein AWB72_04823 [Caballeronia concitans]